MTDEFTTVDLTGQVAKREASVAQAVAFVRDQSTITPNTAIILGSGLGGLADCIESPISITYNDIPGFARSTAAGHRGQLILGTLADVPVVAMAGRFHRYEGWSIDEVTFPVHVMHGLGAKRLVVSNAAGGVNPKLCVGDIIVIRDHINLMSGVSFCSIHPPSLPIGRSDEVYDSHMSKLAMQAAVDGGFTAYEGTYLATFGPTYETRAEYRMQRKFGADVAGMSTVPEVLAASELGLRVLGLSMVTNVANVDIAVQADHREVLEAGRAGAASMESIVRRVLAP